MLQRALRRLPAPHLARLPPAFEGTRGQSAALANRVDHMHLGLAVVALAAPPVRRLQVHHAALEERVVGHGHRQASCAQYSKMRPSPSSRETVAGLYQPSREVSVSRCARSTVEMESS